MRSLPLLLLASLLVLGQPARANVVIAGTRVVYPADKQEVTLQLSNVGEQPPWCRPGSMTTRMPARRMAARHRS